MEKAQKLRNLGLENLGRVYWNLPTPALYEEAIRRYEGILNPRQTWKDPADYDRTAGKLADMFQRNFTENVIEPPIEIMAVGPRSKSG